MKQWVIGLGGTGSKLLEGLVYAAAAGVLTDGKGHHLSEISLIALDTDMTSRRTVSARETFADYEHIREMLDAADEPTPGWFTAFSWTEWPVAVEKTVPQGRDRMLARALLGASSADLLIALAAETRSEHFEKLAGDITAALDEGETVRILLCASSFGAIGQAMLIMLAGALRERLQGREAAIGAVVLLPYYISEGQNEVYNLRTRTLLDRLSAVLDEKLFDQVALLGMPEGIRTEILLEEDGGEPAEAHPIEWLAIRAAARFLAGENDPPVATLRLKDAGIDWSAFGSDAARFRRAYGTLFRAAALYMTGLNDIVRQRLVSGGLDGMIGWQAAYLKGLHRRPAEEKETLTADAAVIERMMLRVLAYLSAAEKNTPAVLRDMDALDAARLQAICNYRALLDAAGRLYLMEDEIIRSGMDDENIVRRGNGDTDADRLLKAADDQLAEVNRLAEEQNRLDRESGGWVKMEIIRRMERGITYAISEESRRAAEMKQAAEDGQNATTQDKDLLYRLDTHLRILHAQADRVADDRRDADTTGLRFKAPALETEGTNGFAEDQTLAVLDALRGPAAACDKKERKRLQHELENRWQALLLGETDSRTVKETLNALAQAAPKGRNAHPLASLMGALLNVAGKEETDRA